MEPFRCPACEQPTISARRKWGASSLSPARCPGCGAAVYVSSRQSSIWRSVEALILTLIVIRGLIGFSWSLVLLAAVVVLVLEAVRLYFAPLVQLRRAGFDE